MRTTKKTVRRECVLLLLLLLLLLTCADSSLHDRDIGQRVKKWPALAAVTSPCRSRAGSRRACAHACTRIDDILNPARVVQLLGRRKTNPRGSVAVAG